MLPVCQCSSWRPVISTIGYSASGRSSAGMMSAGTKRARPVSRGKILGEDHRLAGIAFARARVGHRVLALQPLPRDAGDARHGVPHLVEHLGHGPSPVQARAAADLLDDPQVLARVAGRVEGLAAHLDEAVGVGEAAALLGNVQAGRITSARNAVSVTKMSCTTRCSSVASAARAWWRRGRSSRGSRPSRKCRGSCPRDRVHDLDHREAGLSSSVRRMPRFSNRARASGSATRW